MNEAELRARAHQTVKELVGYDHEVRLLCRHDPEYLKEGIVDGEEIWHGDLVLVTFPGKVGIWYADQEHVLRKAMSAEKVTHVTDGEAFGDSIWRVLSDGVPFCISKRVRDDLRKALGINIHG